MQLVRQIQMKSSPLLDEITFLSKNLYNVAIYTVRQRFFEDNHWTRYQELWTLLKSHEIYQKLHERSGSHPPQQVLKQVDQNFKSFFQAIKSWKKHPSKFMGRPKLPHYLRKNGKNMIFFTSQQCRLKNGFVHLTKKMEQLGFPLIRTDLQTLKGVRIIPYGDRYNIELIYNYIPQDLYLNKNNIMGIDLGLNNIVTKSVNQFYNKQLSKYKSSAKKCNNAHITHRILKFHRKRNNKIRDVFHKTSRKIVNYCIDHNIGTIVIGYNEGWKQKCNIGKRNNQNFVSVPFLKLIQQIEYKSEMVGINVIKTSEEYTSQRCSSCGIVKKSNVNASQNILKKGVPKSVWIGNRGCLNHPVVLKVIN